MLIHLHDACDKKVSLLKGKVNEIQNVDETDKVDNFNEFSKILRISVRQRLKNVDDFNINDSFSKLNDFIVRFP